MKTEIKELEKAISQLNKLRKNLQGKVSKTYFVALVINKDTLLDEIDISCELDELTEDFTIISAYTVDSDINILSLLNVEELNQLVLENLNDLP